MISHDPEKAQTFRIRSCDEKNHDPRKGADFSQVLQTLLRASMRQMRHLIDGLIEHLNHRVIDVVGVRGGKIEPGRRTIYERARDIGNEIIDLGILVFKCLRVLGMDRYVLIGDVENGDLGFCFDVVAPSWIDG